MHRGRRALEVVVALALAATLWLPSLHLAFTPREPVSARFGVIPERAEALLARQLSAFERGDGRAAMRAVNPEWDLMTRMYVVVSLANVALVEPASKPELLARMDAVIDDTLRLVRTQGIHYVLLPYAQQATFQIGPARSQFVDGETALMIALRRLVEDRPELAPELEERVAAMRARMERSPVLSAESYPNECWTFCNTVALAAMTVADAVDGTDHTELARRWVRTARARLVDRKTGLLVSSYTPSGEFKDGPEGSSLWMSLHALQLVDPEFAAEQYALAKRALVGRALGFAWAREWPRDRLGPVDVDSGPIVPWIDASPGSSGLALVAAASFQDDALLKELLTTLDFAGFPVRDRGLRYAAGNALADSVVLYAMTLGPAWDAVRARRSR